MKVDQKTLDLLKKYGFQWYKSQSTDRVEARGIRSVIPAANGFTVLYTETSVFDCSTATVEKIELPEDLEAHWIRVHWLKIEDQRR